MNKTNLINGESLSASLETTLAVEQFLKENYLFRRNVLNGKVELATKQASKNGDNAEEETPDNWRPLTQEALNSIIRRAKSEDGNHGVCTLRGCASIQSHQPLPEQPA